RLRDNGALLVAWVAFRTARRRTAARRRGRALGSGAGSNGEGSGGGQATAQGRPAGPGAPPVVSSGRDRPGRLDPARRGRAWPAPGAVARPADDPRRLRARVRQQPRLRADLPAVALRSPLFRDDSGAAARRAGGAARAPPPALG